jgi:H+/gluconate symporter-like permease
MTIDFDPTPATSEAAQGTGANTKTVIIIAVIAAIVICAVIVFLITRGRKPDDDKL